MNDVDIALDHLQTARNALDEAMGTLLRLGYVIQRKSVEKAYYLTGEAMEAIRCKTPFLDSRNGQDATQPFEH